VSPFSSICRRTCHERQINENPWLWQRGDQVIEGPPVREFRFYKRRRHYSCWHWSSTVARTAANESRLELAQILLADFDPAIVGLAAQPFQMIGDDGGCSVVAMCRTRLWATLPAAGHEWLPGDGQVRHVR
jgi:hypothetical protein